LFETKAIQVHQIATSLEVESRSFVVDVRSSTWVLGICLPLALGALVAPAELAEIAEIAEAVGIAGTAVPAIIGVAALFVTTEAAQVVEAAELSVVGSAAEIE